MGLICHADGHASWPLPTFFYSADGHEPPHVHVERDGHVAKFWLDPVRLAESGGYTRRDLREVDRIVRENQQVVLEAWHDYFGV